MEFVHYGPTLIKQPHECSWLREAKKTTNHPNSLLGLYAWSPHGDSISTLRESDNYRHTFELQPTASHLEMPLGEFSKLSREHLTVRQWLAMRRKMRRVYDAIFIIEDDDKISTAIVLNFDKIINWSSK